MASPAVTWGARDAGASFCVGRLKPAGARLILRRGRGEDGVTAHDKARWDAMKRTLRHLMIAAAILGVAAALLFLVLADVVCLGDFCGS